MNEPVIYREEVRGFMEAMSDVVYYLKQIRWLLGGDDGQEEEEHGDYE